jgi:hypothetical protein
LSCWFAQHHNRARGAAGLFQASATEVLLLQAGALL